jgi:hypothetical protein
MATDVAKTALKGYFNTGDQPTEANFTDLVDSTINQTDTTAQSITSPITLGGIASASAVYVSGALHIESTSTTGRGAGAATGSAYSCKVANINGEAVTTLLVDIEGMKSMNDEGDVIGIASTASSSLMKWSNSINGILYKLEMTCLEAPTGGTEDIDLRSAAAGGATYDTDGSGYTALLAAGGDWAVGKRLGTDGANGTQTQIGADGDHIYLVSGDANTDAVYTAGKFIIKMYGVLSDFS